MAETSASSSSKALLPQFMQPDDEPAATEPARRKANTPKTSLIPFSRRRKQSAKKPRRDSSVEDLPGVASTSTSSSSPSTKGPAADERPLMAGIEPDVPVVPVPNAQIELEGLPACLEDDSKDVYRWAVVYENQRGITIFSIPYYSHLSLLPWDPPAFTLPELPEPPLGKLYPTKSHKPTITLSNYPLPNGEWKWVSKSWMIDMRGDGQVQYDGFEYNWFFRKYRWSATSAAWVRRRRWIRLMIRPAKRHLHPGTGSRTPPSVSPSPSPSVGIPISQSPSPFPNSEGRSQYPRSGIQSLPPSILSPHSAGSSIAPGFIWQGDGADDWERCHDYIRSLTRDGKKLEVWRSWLGLSDVEGEDAKECIDGTNVNKRQWTEDEGLLPSQAIVRTSEGVDVSTIPPREWVVVAIREHMDDILQTFVYPDSRAQFITALRKIQDDLGEDAGKFLDSYQSDFWSYTFLHPGASASSVSMSVKEGKRKVQPPTAEDAGDSHRSHSDRIGLIVPL